MTDKPKFPPPLPRRDRGDDEEEPLVQLSSDLPDDGDWDDAEPTMVGEPLVTPSGGPADQQSPPAPHRERPHQTSSQRPPQTSSQRPPQTSSLPPAGQPAPYPPTSGPGEPAPDTAYAPGFQDALPLFVVSGVLCLVLMLIVTVRQWLAPWAPLLAGLGLAAALSASIGYLYCERDRQRSALLGFGLGAALALPTALWMISPIRVAAIERLGEHLPETVYQEAIEDPARAVRISACVVAAENGGSLLESQIVDLFVGAPSEGVACIDRLRDSSPDRALALTSRLARRWAMALHNQDAKLVCGTASHLFSLNTPDAPRPAQQLTYCATTSTDDSISKCCANAITEQIDRPDKYVVALGEPSSVAPQRRMHLFSAMVAYAFRGVDATRTSLPTLERRLLRKKPVQDWILALGCESLFSAQRAADVVSGLEAIVESKACGAADEMDRSYSNWMRICVGLASNEAPTEQMCSLVRGEAVAQAVGSASAEVRKALDAVYSSEIGRSIHRGHARMNYFAGTADAQGEFMANALDPSRAGIRDAQSRHLARQIGGNYAQAMRQLKEQAATVQKKDRVDYDESAQNLLKRRPYKPQATWKEVQEHMSTTDRAKINDQLRESRKKLQR